MDYDEISGDGDIRSKLEELYRQGKIGAVPNLANLPNDIKEQTAKKVMHHCLETLMKTYVAMDMLGHCLINATDAITGTKYTLKFTAGEKDEHMG